MHMLVFYSHNSKVNSDIIIIEHEKMQNDKMPFLCMNF